MNVGVDDAGENHQIARTDFQLRRARKIVSERDNFPFADSDVLLASNEQIEITHGANDEARMTNDELSPNDEARNPPRVRHSCFDIPSSFDIRASSFFRSPDPQSAHAAVGIDVQAEVRAVSDKGKFFLEEMPRV